MKKEPFVTKAQLDEIIKTYPTPFHLYDEKGMRENMKALKEAFSWNKGYREYFAVKATPNPFLINILREYGCGCDCSSYTELMLSDAIGATGEDIMFSSNDTPAEEFVLADKLNAIINLDDITHIDFLEKAIGHIPETISCRYNPGGMFKISNDIMDNPGDAKYGMTTEQLFEAFKILKAKGAKEFGIHAFLASNTVTNEYYPMLAKVLFEVAVKLQKETGVHIKFINLSGGVGIPYKPDQEPNDIRAIGDGVRRVYEEVLVPAGMGDVAIYTEMGRFMMGPYGCLVTTAIHEKHTHKEYIGVDACAVNLMRPAMYGAYHHITVMGKEDTPCDHKYDVTGSLCENNDKFAIDRMLPKIDMGDILVIHDTGAHGFSMGYNYNGKLKSAEVLLKEDGSTQLIRRAETPADYFATFDCFDIGKENGSVAIFDAEKEAKKEYETNLDNSMKEAGFDETGVSDELKANYRKLFEKMLKSANYKVGEAKEAGDDEFKVSVEVQPFTAFSTVSEELDNWVTDTYSNIEYVPSDEELNEAIMKKMYELMDEKMNNPTYGDKTTVTVNVKVDKDGAYYIPQKDLTAVDDALFPEDSL